MKNNGKSHKIAKISAFLTACLLLTLASCTGADLRDSFPASPIFTACQAFRRANDRWPANFEELKLFSSSRFGESHLERYSAVEFMPSSDKRCMVEGTYSGDGKRMHFRMTVPSRSE